MTVNPETEPKMKFGIHSLLFTETFLEKDLPRLETFKNMGFDAVEIIPFDPQAFPASDVRKRAAELGLEMNIGYGMPADKNIIDPDPAVRAKGLEFSKYLVDICAEVEAKVFGGMIYCGWGYLTGSMRTEKEWKWAVENYQQVAEYAQKNVPGLILGIEPVNRFESHFINTAEDALRFISDVDHSNVKVHLDTFHMIREEDDIAGAVERTGDKLGYVHACENQRGIPGTGLIPWEAFFTALKGVNYQGCVTIESFDPNMPNIARLCCIWRKLAESPEQLATQGLQYLRQVAAKVS